jgi:hypothetical protein
MPRSLLPPTAGSLVNPAERCRPSDERRERRNLYGQVSIGAYGFCRRSHRLGIGEKVWTGLTRQRRKRSRHRSGAVSRFGKKWYQCPSGGAWPRSSPAATKRGAEGAGLEVGHVLPDHQTHRSSPIHLTRSDRSSADLYSMGVGRSSTSNRRRPERRDCAEGHIADAHCWAPWNCRSDR